MFETLLELWNEIPPWFHAVTALVAAASGVTALTPTKKDDQIYDFVMGVLNFLALNVFKNKNADSE